MSILLEIRNLTVNAGGRTLLKNLNLAVPKGEVHVLFGPNGSGKTSLVMTIMGFSSYKVTSGQILFKGRDITDLGITERARLGLGIAQQRPPTIPGVKLRQVLDYATAGNSAKPANINGFLEDLNTKAFLDRDINAGLSGGEIKRSELIQLLVSQPVFSMLDEPDSGVDLDSLPLAGRLVNELFSIEAERPVHRRSGLIITHTGHILDYVKADKAHVMIDGRIACSGNPELVMSAIGEHGYDGCVRCIRKGAEPCHGEPRTDN